jgi:hypothetical protein
MLGNKNRGIHDPYPKCLLRLAANPALKTFPLSPYTMLDGKKFLSLMVAGIKRLLVYVCVTGQQRDGLLLLVLDCLSLKVNNDSAWIATRP